MRSVYKDFDDAPKELKKKGWQHSSVKEALYKIYNGKCAYTEEKLVFEEACIEHYRPHNKYPNPQNEWSNLLLVSKVVLVSRRDNFELLGDKVTFISEHNKRADSRFLMSEKPLLLNPEIDRPENHFNFTIDGIIQSTTQRGNYTLNVCNLNYSSLIINRKKRINFIVSELEKIAENHLLHKEYEKTQKSVFEILNYIMKNTSKENEYSLLYMSMLRRLHNFFPISKEPEGFSVILEKINKEYFSPEIVIKLNDNTEQTLSSVQNKDDRMPYALVSHRVENFPRINELEINNIPVNTQWIFLTGENGHGKTSFLQSIALGMYGLKGNNLKKDY